MNMIQNHPPLAYKEPIRSAKRKNEFVDITSHPFHPFACIKTVRGQVRTEPDLEADKPSKRTSRLCYYISILFLTVIIVILGGFIAFLVTHPGVIGKSCPASVNFTQPYKPNHSRTVTPMRFYNTTTTSTQSVTKTHPGAQATGTGTSTYSGLDPVAIATCLGVLENACAMKNPPTTFGQCDPLFVFFYCDLTDMMVFRGAMKLDTDGSSPVCQPMKKFCSKAIPLSRIPLADVSP